MDGWTDGRMDGRTDGWMDGRTDGRSSKCRVVGQKSERMDERCTDKFAIIIHE